MIDLNEIRLIGLDLDGTVLTNDKRLSPRTKAAIERAIDCGIVVMPATGRPVTGIPGEFADMPGVRYLLGSNGAAVYDKKEKRFVVQNCIAHSAVREALELYGKLEGTFELYIDGVPYIAKEDYADLDHLIPEPHIREYVKKTRTVVEDIRTVLEANAGNVEKINMCFPTVEATDEAMALLPQIPSVTGVRGLPFNLELSKAGIDKGEGLLQLAAVLGIKKEQVLACGDSENDLEMIRKVGVGAAMANAVLAVKEAADLVLAFTNEEEGVAWLLEAIVRQQEERKKMDEI